VIAICDQLGYRSELLTLQLPGEEHRFPPETIIHRMPASFPARFLASRRAANWIEKHHDEYDLIITHEIWPLMILQVGLRLCRCLTPFVMVPHASLHPSNLIRKAAFKYLLSRIVVARMLAQVNTVWTSSELELTQLHTFSTNPQTIVLPPPVEISARPGDRDRFRRKTGATEGDLIVAFSGRFHPVKQVDLLIRAVAAARTRYPQLRLVLAGAGKPSIEHDLRNLVAASDMKSCTTFLGFVGDEARNDLLAGCDLFAMPSTWENFSVASVEALQAGVPVLVSRHIGIADEVRTAAAGWVTEPVLPEFAAALGEIASSSSELKRRANNARALGAQFQPSKLMDRYARALQRAAARPS
jgi:glycosyltransferase involved in cell wall biosynthesis